MRAQRTVAGLLLLAILAAIGGLQAAGNPIVITTVLMPQEGIDALVFADGGRLFALVEGVYSFSSEEVSSTKMYYPVPPDAFLYAMGTGRSLDYHAKETVAQVKVRLELTPTDLEALTGHKPVDYQLDREAGETVITLTKTSEPFSPLTEDLLIKFKKILSVPEALDADGDGRISGEEMLQAIRYWIDDAEVPGTGGQQVSDLTLHKLAEFWIAGERFVLTSYQARNRAIAYLLERHPDCGLPEEAIWDPERATPEGLLGHETICYTYGDWMIEVGYPVVPFPDYDVTVTNDATGFTWQGTVQATGVVEER